MLTLIYTSGTTGPPKGVQLTHANLIAAVQRLRRGDRVPGRRPGRLVPADGAHRRARLLATTCRCCSASRPPDCPDPRQVVAYLPEVRPTWFFAVPRIWEKLKAAIEAGIEAEQDEARKQATKWALDVGLRKVRAEQAGEPVPDELRAEHAKADELVLSKIRERLGLDQVESCNVGAAPTPREVIEFFHAIGIPLAELWGMSETTRLRHLQPARPDQDRHGRAAVARRRDQARRGRRGADPRAGGHARLPQPAREDRARRSTPTAGCTPATSASSTRTAT